ncbi:MAG: hypothetical protein AAF821_10125 [Cyanobacteria bacterium P01_D01_bin.156]
MKAIAIVGNTHQPEALLTDLLHWHGLSVFQVESDETLLPLLSFIAPELVLVESAPGLDIQEVCDRIKHSSVVGHIPVMVCSNTYVAPACGGADAYLAGAYDAEDIFAHIQALMSLSQTSIGKVVTSSAGLDA